MQIRELRFNRVGRILLCDPGSANRGAKCGWIELQVVCQESVRALRCDIKWRQCAFREMPEIGCHDYITLAGNSRSYNMTIVWILWQRYAFYQVPVSCNRRAGYGGIHEIPRPFQFRST